MAIACLLVGAFHVAARADAAPDYCNFPSGNIALPSHYMNPPMMAVGDSVYNGVRTLSITPQMPRYSPPALVAGALKEKFLTPQYPMPVITDFERALRSAADLALAVSRMQANLNTWLYNPPTYTAALLFDNISMGSARAEDLLGLNWNYANAQVQKIKASIKPGQGVLDLLPDLFSLFEYTNARFVLNPAQKPGVKRTPDLTSLAPLAQVALRKPKRLLVNIGANNGYWSLAFEAKDGWDDTDGVSSTVEFTRKFPEHMKQVAACLAALPKGPGGVEHIYVNNLPPLSVLANLMPLDRNTLAPLQPDCGKKYYASYYNYFGQGYGVIAGKTLCEWDKSVAEVNKQVAQILKDTGDDRISVVDIASAVEKYDEKHLLDAALTVKLDNKFLLDNWPIRGMLLFFPHAGGGLFEGDNMHPSASGYSIIADAVLKQIAVVEGGPPATVNLDALYRANPNAVFPPLAMIDMVAQIYRDYRIANQGGYTGVQAMVATQKTQTRNYNNVINAMRVMGGVGDEVTSQQ